MKKLLSLLLVLAASACAPYHLIPAGPVEFPGKHTSVQTDIPWNARNDDAVYTWTQDGPGLENMIFHLEVEDGKTIAKSLDKEAQQNPLLVLVGQVPDEVSFRFNRAMTEPEIMDLFVASFGKITQTPVTATNLRPATLGGHPGFRFDYAFTGRDEVRRKGFAVGAVVEGKLTLVHYYGTELYHFEKYRAAAEQVIASLQIRKS